MNILVLLPVNDRHRAILESSAPGEDFIYTSADAITREHDGTTYYFCGEHCANNFMKAPQLFLEN